MNPAGTPATTLATAAIRVGLIIVSAFLMWRIARILVGRIETAIRSGTEGFAIEREKRAATLGKMLRRASWIVIVIVTSLMAVRELGFDVTPALAAAGGVGTAAGRRARNLGRGSLRGVTV